MKMNNLLLLKLIMLPLLVVINCGNGMIISNGAAEDGDRSAGEKAEKLWATDKVLDVPESVFYDEDREMLYVSNISGEPLEKDGKGFISRLSTDGTVEQLEWVTGLNAPKGMGLVEDKLYVTDIDRVVEIDTETGEIIEFFEVEGAKFLNDITVDNENRIYITDMKTGAIHRLVKGQLQEWFPRGSFRNPNGIYFHEEMIYLGTRDAIIKIDIGDKDNQQVLLEVERPVDGLEVSHEGNMIFSDWHGKVQMLERESEEPVVLFNTSPQKINAADIHLMKNKDILLVPTFFDNRVMAYELKY